MAESPIPSGFSKRELVSCAHRELELRKRHYPRMVAMGKMSSAARDREIAAMQAIVQTLEAVDDRPAAQSDLPLAPAAAR